MPDTGEPDQHPAVGDITVADPAVVGLPSTAGQIATFGLGVIPSYGAIAKRASWSKLVG